MPNMLILLDQDEWWVTHELRRVRVQRMEPSHAHNTFEMLARHPRLLIWRIRLESIYAMCWPDNTPEDIVEERFDKMEEMTDREWLRETPLGKALLARAASP